MKRKNYRPYLALALFVLALFHIPESWARGLRYSSVSLASTFWSVGAREFIGDSDAQVESLLLRRENEALRRALFSEERLESQLKKYEKILSVNDEELEAFFRRRQKTAETLINLQMRFLHAPVVYREPTTWNCTVWIGVGEKDNEALDAPIVAVNSPVLKGGYLVGVVERVGRSKSLVRLLTDSELVPSVRVARGESRNRELLELLELLLEPISLRKEEHDVLSAIEALKERLEKSGNEKYLAKGELMGTSSSVWRGRSHTLKGVGFNYDFSDEEGPALELRSGKPLENLGKEENLPLIERGDLLVTTGMDGIFPADLPVAWVSLVKPLEEGAVAFEIEAQLCSGSLRNLSDVEVLPPLGFK